MAVRYSRLDGKEFDRGYTSQLLLEYENKNSIYFELNKVSRH